MLRVESCLLKPISSCLTGDRGRKTGNAVRFGNYFITLIVIGWPLVRIATGFNINSRGLRNAAQRS